MAGAQDAVVGHQVVYGVAREDAHRHGGLADLPAHDLAIGEGSPFDLGGAPLARGGFPFQSRVQREHGKLVGIPARAQDVAQVTADAAGSGHPARAPKVALPTATSRSRSSNTSMSATATVRPARRTVATAVRPESTTGRR